METAALVGIVSQGLIRKPHERLYYSYTDENIFRQLRHIRNTGILPPWNCLFFTLKEQLPEYVRLNHEE